MCVFMDLYVYVYAFKYDNLLVHHHVLTVRLHVSIRRLHVCRDATDGGDCLKVRVSFRKRATNSRALLQKMTYKDTDGRLKEYYNSQNRIPYLYRSFPAKVTCI